MSARTSRALIVDDAPDVVAMVASLLRHEGYEVWTASDGEEALAVAREVGPDLVVLDLTLPKVDGIEVCKRLRAFSDAYVIMLTARTEEGDLLVGLAVGADDFMTKPFSPREMVARVRSLRRRPRGGAQDEAERRFGDLVIDLVSRQVRIDGAEITLTKIEYDLLVALSSNPPQAVTRQMLLDAVWGPGWHGSDHVIDVHVTNLRRKLGDDPGSPRFIRTVRGVGFRMEDPPLTA